MTRIKVVHALLILGALAGCNSSDSDTSSADASVTTGDGGIVAQGDGSIVAQGDGSVSTTHDASVTMDASVSAADGSVVGADASGGRDAGSAPDGSASFDASIGADAAADASLSLSVVEQTVHVNAPESSSLTNGINAAALALDAHDVAHIAYAFWDSTSHRCEYIERSATGVLSTPVVLDDSANPTGVSVIAIGDTVYVTCTDMFGGVKLAKRQSGTWTTGTTTLSGQFNKTHQLISDSHGTLHFIGASSGQLVHGTFDGTNWSTDHPTATLTSDMHRTSAVFDSHDALHVLFKNSDYDWVHATRTGSTWTTETLTGETETWYSPYLLVDDAGNAFIVTSSSDGILRYDHAIDGWHSTVLTSESWHTFGGAVATAADDVVTIESISSSSDAVIYTGSTATALSIRDEPIISGSIGENSMRIGSDGRIYFQSYNSFAFEPLKLWVLTLP